MTFSNDIFKTFGFYYVFFLLLKNKRRLEYNIIQSSINGEPAVNKTGMICLLRGETYSFMGI